MVGFGGLDLRGLHGVASRWRSARDSLRFRLASRVVVAMLASFGVGNTLLMVTAAQQLIARQQSVELDRTLMLDRHLHAWEEDIRQTLRALSLNSAIRSMEARRAAPILQPVYAVRPLRHWRLWRADGTLLSHTGEMANIRLQERRILRDPGFREALRGRFNFQVDAIQAGGRLDACLLASQPIYGLTNPAAVAGVLSFCLPLSKLGDDSGLLLLGGSALQGVDKSGRLVGWIEAHRGKYSGRAFFLLSRRGNLVFPVNSGTRYSHLSLLSPSKVMASGWAPFVRLAQKGFQGQVFRRVVVHGIVFYMLVAPASSEWMGVAVIDEATIFAPLRRSLRDLILIQICGLLVTTLVIVLACDRVANPIRQAGRAIKAISRGDFEVQLVKSYRGELGELFASVNETGGQLKALLAQALAHAATDQQLETAKLIQRSFLVHTLPAEPGAELAAFFEPAFEIGADWYDALSLDGCVVLAVADVCDKGVASALFMGVFRTLVRYALSYATDRSDPEGLLKRVVSLVNDYMAVNHGDTVMFATMFLAHFCPATGRLSYVSAGHEAPLLRQGGACQRLEGSGPAMGVFPGATYDLGHADLGPGDVLVVYTDGIIDARSPANVSFAIEGLEASLLALPDGLSAGQIADAIRADVRRHIDTAAQFDDMTMMVLRVV